MWNAQYWEDIGKCRPLWVWQLDSLNASTLLKLTRKVLVHPASCFSQYSLSRLSHRAKLFRGLPIGPGVSRDHVGLHNTGNMVAGSHPDIGRLHHSFSPPHHLLLPIRRQNSLTHHAVVLHFAKVLRSLSPYNSNCTQEQESTGASSSSKPRLKAAARKRLALLLTGRSPGVHDWLVSPEWQEHLP